MFHESQVETPVIQEDAGRNMQAQGVSVLKRNKCLSYGIEGSFGGRSWKSFQGVQLNRNAQNQIGRNI